MLAFKAADFLLKNSGLLCDLIFAHTDIYIFLEIIICSFNNNQLRNVPMAKLFMSCTGQFPVFCNNNASISGFPLGATPGNPGGFVQMPIQTSSNPPEEFWQIPCPLDATYEFYAQKLAVCFA